VRLMRVGLVAIACACVAALAACGGSDKTSTQSGSSTAKSSAAVTVGFVLPTVDGNPFYKAVADAAQAEADRLDGVTLQFSAPTGTFSPQKYLDAIDTMGSRGIKAIAFDPYDAKLFTATINGLDARGVPVVSVGDPPIPGAKEAAVINTDSEGAVREGIASMVKAMGGKGTAAILTFPGNIVVTARVDAAKTALKGAGIAIAGSAPVDCTEVKGANSTQDLLQAHPEITAVFAPCGLSGLGAAKAVAQANKKVTVYSFDGSQDELKAVQDGSLAGTIAQRPTELGQTTVRTLAAVARGESVKPLQLTGYDVITKANVAQFIGK
jgi:ribose transport system substrate-binding protein